MRLGLEKNRISWKGFGATKPLRDNNSVEGRQRNRRVEFLISKELE
jgi:OOP family OmpA-OmpF porin